MLNIKSADGAGLAFPALRGMSAYEIAVKNGFEGTEAEWLNSLRPKPVFIISCNDGNEVALAYYDNPERKVTAQELVDMYFAGNGYLTDGDPISGSYRISAVFVASSSINVIYGSWTVNVSNINNSDFEAAMAKYLP